MRLEQKEHSKTIEYGVNNEFPITLRIKPTSHEQLCYKCQSLIEKGSLQAKIRDGQWARHLGEDEFNKGKQYRSHCTGVLNQGVGVQMFSRGIFRAPRFLYLHDSCFFCLMTKLAMEARSSMPNCEKCLDRFICFTKEFSPSAPSGYIPTSASKRKTFRKTKFFHQDGNLYVKGQVPRKRTKKPAWQGKTKSQTVKK